MKQAIAYVALSVGFYLVACGESQSSDGSSCAAGAGGAADDATPDGGTGGKGGGVPSPSAGTTSAGAGGDGGQPPLVMGGAAGAEPEAGAGGISDTGEAGMGGEVSGEGGAGGAPEPTSIEPGDLEGLALWLEVSTDTCVRDAQDQVSSCADLSGNANHAAQADAALQPTFIAANLPSRPALRFDDEPSILLIADSPTLRFGEGDCTFMLVGRWRNDHLPTATYAGAGVMLAKQNQTFPYEGMVFFANYQSLYGAPSMRRLGIQLALGGTLALSASGNLNDDVFRLYVARRVGQDLEVRINGAFEGRTRINEPTSIDGAGQPLILGGQVGYQLRGDISELVVIGGALPESDLVRLENGLRTKHGL